MMKIISLVVSAAVAPASAASAAVASVPPDVLRAAGEVRWTPDRVAHLIGATPKVETHLHLDGVPSAEMIRQFAVSQNYAPLASMSVAEIKALYVVDRPRASLPDVLAAFETAYPVLRAPDAVQAMAYQAAAAASRQQVRYLEARFAPILQAAEGFTSEQALLAAFRGLSSGEQDFGVRSGVIVCLIRGLVREKNARMIDLAIKYKNHGVVGIDLAGNEAAQPLSDFKDLFRRAKAAGLKLTAHAGEVPDSRDIETALQIGVDRLGHATLLAGRPDLLEKVVARRTPIEVNLTSNLRTGAIERIADHPAKAWHAAGAPITLSTDDPGVFGIDLNGEYALLASELGFAPADILTVVFNGVDALFLPRASKENLRESFRRELIQILARLKAEP